MWWARALDVVSGIAVLLLISIVVFGGFRLRYGDLRITAQDVWRPLAVLVLAAGVRHWLVPRPSWPARLRAGLLAAWAAPVTRVVLPALIASRLMVLAVGYLGVVLVGYPDKLQPPFRVSSNELVNLPVRWDAGWYLGIALERLRLRPERAADGAAEHRVLPGVSDGDARRHGVAGRPHRCGPTSGRRGNRVEWQYAQHRRAPGGGPAREHRRLRLGRSSTCTAWRARWAATRPRRRRRWSWPARGRARSSTAPSIRRALFFLGVVGAWYHLRERQWAAAFAWGLVAGLSRPNGFLVSVPLALLAVADWRAIWRGDPAAPPDGAARRRRRRPGPASAC